MVYSRNNYMASLQSSVLNNELLHFFDVDYHKLLFSLLLDGHTFYYKMTMASMLTNRHLLRKGNKLVT